MPQELYPFIDGRRVKGAGGRFGDVYNPATGEVGKRVPLASADETRAAVGAAAAALPGLLREGDVVLVKGSQSVRTERIVEALLANPVDLSRLVRQEKAWKRKA